jgi:hypothetical protein
MRALLSAALVLTSVFAANINTSIKEADNIVKEIQKTQKDLRQKVQINYITANDLKKINQKLANYQQKLNSMNIDYKNASPKEIETFTKKVAALSAKVNSFANEIFTIAKEVKNSDTKAPLAAQAIVQINNIAQNLENISSNIPVENLPANVQGNVILAQSTITENSMNLQQKAQDMAQTLVKNANKFSSKISQSKEDELVSAAHESLTEEKQKEEDDKNNNNNQNPLMMLMGQMMQNSPMANNPMMQKMMQNSPMNSGNGMNNPMNNNNNMNNPMNSPMMGGMMQNAPMANEATGMMGR